jgi:hypothetical protein
MEDLSASRRAAAQLAINHVDANELEKLLAYYRRVGNDRKFRTLVIRLASQNIFIYSNQTKKYISQIQSIILPNLPSQPNEALQFLGWTVRFMRYYGKHQDEALAIIGEKRIQPIVIKGTI